MYPRPRNKAYWSIQRRLVRQVWDQYGGQTHPQRPCSGGTVGHGALLPLDGELGLLLDGELELALDGELGLLLGGEWRLSLEGDEKTIQLND